MKSAVAKAWIGHIEPLPFSNPVEISGDGQTVVSERHVWNREKVLSHCRKSLALGHSLEMEVVVGIVSPTHGGF